MSMQRLDVFLTETGRFESRSRAKDAILAGLVTVDGTPQRKPAAPVDERCEIAVAQRGLPPFVSRGGQKLEAALDAFQIDVAGLTILDVGASTGGFTDCLLSRGARHVFAIDAGVGQLHERLRADARVTSLEKTNARSLLPAQINHGENDFAVIDVSFISLEKVLLPVREQLRSSARVLCLVKPQFEVGPERLGGSGVVRDETLRRFAVEKIERFGRAHGLTPSDPFRSPLPGRDGNREYFLLFENA